MRCSSARLRRRCAPDWQKHYKAKRHSPNFAELHNLVVKAVGLVEPLRAALEPKASMIRAAFVYGSAAAGGDRTTSDIDVLVMSDKLTCAGVYDALQAAEEVLARPAQP